MKLVFSFLASSLSFWMIGVEFFAVGMFLYNEILQSQYLIQNMSSE